MHLLVLAKRPEPGRAKTRLIPWLGAERAAAVAAAALADTFDAALASAADRVVVAFDGDPSGFVPRGVEVVAQCAGDLADRLGAAWDHAGGPGLQIGMDTPQLTAEDLDDALSRLVAPGTDAVLGPAVDGGWWAIGQHRAHRGLFTGIPTSRADTGSRQLERLATLGLATTLLPVHRDVDEPPDAIAVAAEAPGTRFALLVQAFVRTLGPPDERPAVPALAATPGRAG